MAITKLPLRQVEQIPVDSVDRFVADGIYNRFYLGYVPILDSMLVYVNGLLQEPTIDYTVDIVSEHPFVTINATPARTDRVVIQYRRTEARRISKRVSSYGNWDNVPVTYYIDSSTGYLFYAGGDLYTQHSTFTSYPNLPSMYGLASFNISERFFYLDSTGMVRNNGGNSDNGSLGNNGSGTSIARPGSYSMIAHTTFNGAAIDAATGQIFTWGYNNTGQVGDITTTNRSSPVSIARPDSYITVAWTQNVNNDGQVSATAIDHEGNAWSWGYSVLGTLGIGSGVTSKSSPVSVIRSGPYKLAAGGDLYMVLLDTMGHAWSFGRNTSGSLGVGNTTNYSSPVSVQCEAQLVNLSTSIGRHVLAVDSSGHLWSWGYNNYGQLGQGDTTSRSAPISINHPNSFVRVYAEGQWSFAIDHTNVMWAWGRNQYGQLGVGDLNNRSAPVSVKKV